jgi:prolipoprotein diacylglyceryltransferase
LLVNSSALYTFNTPLALPIATRPLSAQPTTISELVRFWNERQKNRDCVIDTIAIANGLDGEGSAIHGTLVMCGVNASLGSEVKQMHKSFLPHAKNGSFTMFELVMQSKREEKKIQVLDVLDKILQSWPHGLTRQLKKTNK